MRPVTFFFYHIPVDDIPQGVHVVGAAVLVIQVVRVLPPSNPRRGFSPARTGLLPLLSLVICSLPFLSTDNQAQPEPNNPTAAALNSFLKFSKLPKSRLIASPSLPPGSFLRRFRGELQEVQIVVQYLSRIIEYSSVRC